MSIGTESKDDEDDEEEGAAQGTAYECGEGYLEMQMWWKRNFSNRVSWKGDCGLL